MNSDRTTDRDYPTQTLFLRPRFNIVVVRGGMQVEVRAQDDSDRMQRLLASIIPGRETAHA